MRGSAKSLLKGVKIGDRIRIEKGGRILEGHLMPRHELGDDRHIVIKLDSGYNVGIEISGIRIEKMKWEKKERKQRKLAEFKMRGKSVTLVGTGGTIASKIDYKTGAVHPAFSTEELLNAMPELASLANIKTKLLFNILSENMAPKLWKQIAQECAKELNGGAHGVIIAHGTDTMGYTAAALSFMLRNLNKPVVLVGSQRSSDRPSSDASMNLLAGIKVACSDIGEVVAVMHGSPSDNYSLIHRGTRVRKMHTSRRDAFRSINEVPIGEVNEKIMIYQDYRKRKNTKVKADTRLNENVALVKIYPGISEKTMNHFIENYDGIVIEGTGLGHVPSRLLKPIEKAGKEEKPVVMTSQTLYGRVNMKVYSTGRELLEIGVIPGGDMLPEVAYVKLMHVLAHAKDYGEVKTMMQTNIAGELSKRSSPDAL